MRSLTAPGGRSASTAHDAGSDTASGNASGPGPGRRVWGLAGLITMIGLAIPGAWLIVHAGIPGNGPNGQAPLTTPTGTVTVTQPVTSLSVESYGAPIQVTARPVHRVTVTEAVSYDPGAGAAPEVTAAVSHGRLTLAAPACATSDCSVGFTVIVPSGVAVTAESDNGPVTVSGTADTDLDSGGGQVTATRIDGLLTVTSENGNVVVNGQAGQPGGGAAGGSRPGSGAILNKVMVMTGGGNARLTFTSAPANVNVSTSNGSATLAMPGGPYNVTADSGGGPPPYVGVPISASARRSITVSTQGGALSIERN